MISKVTTRMLEKCVDNDGMETFRIIIDFSCKFDEVLQTSC